MSNLMVIAFIGFLVWVLLAMLVAGDASNRGYSGLAWFLITLVFGVIGVLFYLVLRTEGSPDVVIICPSCKTSNPEENQYCAGCGTEISGLKPDSEETASTGGMSLIAAVRSGFGLFE